MPSKNNNNSNKDDQDWLDTLAGKTIADTYLNSEPNEAQLLREALLRRYYEQTLEAQPMQEGHPLLERLTALGYIKADQDEHTNDSSTLTSSSTAEAKQTKSLFHYLQSLWEVFFAKPFIPIATACFMMMLHLPLYFSQYNDVTSANISTEPILLPKSVNTHYYNDTQSDATPLKTAADFAKKLNSMAISATLKPTSKGWLLHFRVVAEPSKERFQQLKQLLKEKKQTLPVMHYPFDVDILFLPLIEDKPIKTYSLLHSTSQTPSITEKAQQLRDQFEALGVKTNIKPHRNTHTTKHGVDIDLQFPEVLSDAVLELMDRYGLEPLLLKPQFRQLRIHIRSG